jgi:peptidoglycan hydrolase-like protein with peptidoglycan-binding domain
MSVEAIRQLLNQGTAVSAPRAAQAAGWGQTPSSFDAHLESALTSVQPLPVSQAAVAEAGLRHTVAVAENWQVRLAVADPVPEAPISTEALLSSEALRQAQDLASAVSPKPAQAMAAESVWEVQQAIPASSATPLVEAPGALTQTGNGEADELVERVLGLRLGRGLSADAAIRDVASAQTLLVSLGYDIGRFGPYANGVDGVLGAHTSQALQRFQSEQGLAQTGTLTAETSARLLAQGKASLDRISADWQAALGQSPFAAEAYQGTANPYWYVRFVAQGGDDPQTMGNIDPVFKGRLAALARDAGQVAAFGEGFRSIERQAWFYQRYLDGTGALAAKPGHSRHNMGLAVDAQSGWLQQLDEGKSVAVQNTLLQYGLCKPMADGEGRGREPWHIEPVETRLGSDTSANA